MTNESKQKNPFSLLDTRVQVDGRNGVHDGIVNRVFRADLVEVKLEDGKLIYAARSSRDPDQWVDPADDDMWMDPSYSAAHPWRPGDAFNIDAYAWAAHGIMQGGDMVDLPLSASVIAVEGTKSATIHFDPVQIDSELLKRVKLAGSKRERGKRARRPSK